jgi:hypothetical protein
MEKDMNLPEREPKPQTYRVVGVATDGSRIILDERLTHERAEKMKELILEEGAFPTVNIEVE